MYAFVIRCYLRQEACAIRHTAATPERRPVQKCPNEISTPQNRETLRAAGVTHIVNCVGMLVPNCFADEIDYLTLFLLGELINALFQPLGYSSASL